jgi:hypothetical protein
MARTKHVSTLESMRPNQTARGRAHTPLGTDFISRLSESIRRTNIEVGSTFEIGFDL